MAPPATPASSSPIHAPELERQREEIRLSLRRANFAFVLVLLLLLALALAVVWKARQSAQEAARARAATASAETELWNARLSQARARRMAGGPGARVETSATIRELTQRPNLTMRQRLDLRQETIAQLALVDVAPAEPWLGQVRDYYVRAWDSRLTQFVEDAGTEFRLWNWNSRKLAGTFRPPDNTTLARAAFSPDDQSLVTVFAPANRAQFLNLSTKRVEWEAQSMAGPFFTPSFSADGRWLALYPDRHVTLHDLRANGAPRTLRLDREVQDALFAPDSRRLAAGFQNRIEIWEVPSGKTLHRLDLPFDLHLMDWHPDGRRLALAGGSGYGALWIWSLDAIPFNESPAAMTLPKEILPPGVQPLEGHQNRIIFLRFTADGNLLVSRGWDSVSKFWDPVSGRLLLADTRIQVAALSRPGAFVANFIDSILGSDRVGFALPSLLEPSSFRPVAFIGTGKHAGSEVHFSPDGRFLLTTHHNEGSRLWEFATGKLVAILPGWENAAFTHDGAVLTFGYDVVRRFEIASLLQNKTPEQAGKVWLRPQGEAVFKGEISPDGRTLLLALGNQIAWIDLTEKEPPRIIQQRAQRAELSADRQWYVSHHHHLPTLVRRSSDASVALTLPAYSRARFSPNGRSLAVATREHVRLLEPGSPNAWPEVWRIPVEIGAGLHPALAFSPDGRWLATAYDRYNVRLHDAATGRELATLSPPRPDQIPVPDGLAFSPDGRWLVALKYDGEIIAWDLPGTQAALEQLGLHWDRDLPEKQRDSTPTATAALVTGSAESAAFVAAALALIAGMFVLVVQRRVVRGYECLDAIAAEQRHKLQTAQDELRHSQKMRALGTLAAGIAHDFNNLLSVIRLSKQLAAEQTQPAGAANENLDAIDSAVAAGEQIVHSMLGYSRAHQLNQEYSVAEALNQTVAMLGRKFLAGIILQTVDVILLDHVLAGGELGLSFLPGLKQLAAHVPVIVITGTLGLEEQLEALQGPLAAHYVLKKPLHLQKLRDTVKQAVDDCGFGEMVRTIRSLERAERIATNERERLFTERLARQYDLLKRLRNSSHKLNISELAAEYQVDRHTIRRDLHDLVNRGQLSAHIIDQWKQT